MPPIIKPDAGKLLYLALGFLVVPLVIKRIRP